MANTSSWTRQAWDAALPIYNQILDHPFIKELAAGTLAPDKFDRYLAQDELYVGNYGRQMFELAELIPDPVQHDMFYAFAKEGIEGEKAMHALLIDRFGIDTQVQPSQVTAAYNAHTEAAIRSGSKEIGLAAMLPCMWVYNEVGLHILRTAAVEGNPYREWIQEYGNEAFTAGVAQVLELADSYAAAAPEDIRERMTSAYIEATRFEYLFWDYGYNG
ncbi:MAG: TenA family protein [Bacteroidales bacterium]|jgi:thiaminase/transcriptional activator TenA|nr:TenA family protein [Bacteroidales bacterium]